MSVAELIVVKPKKVGIIPCNGEELPEGTLTRFACRKVLDELKPGNTVTICLPLFTAGDQGERGFAQKFPTITVDGCQKRCSRIVTEKFSGKPRHSIVITDLLKELGHQAPASTRALTEQDRETVDLIAGEIAKKVEEILAE
jgi:hypothetical protein